MGQLKQSLKRQASPKLLMALRVGQLKQSLKRQASPKLIGTLRVGQLKPLKRQASPRLFSRLKRALALASGSLFLSFGSQSCEKTAQQPRSVFGQNSSHAIEAMIES